MLSRQVVDADLSARGPLGVYVEWRHVAMFNDQVGMGDDVPRPAGVYAEWMQI